MIFNKRQHTAELARQLQHRLSLAKGPQAWSIGSRKLRDRDATLFFFFLFFAYWGDAGLRGDAKSLAAKVDRD